jgi:hypothetical protein
MGSDTFFLQFTYPCAQEDGACEADLGAGKNGFKRGKLASSSLDN